MPACGREAGFPSPRLQRDASPEDIPTSQLNQLHVLRVIYEHDAELESFKADYFAGQL